MPKRVCEQRSQKFTPIRRQVLQALLSSHRPLGAYEVIDELAKSMPRPAPITVYRALDFLMENGLVHRIESRNAYLACAHDHDAASMVAFLICERCGSVGEIPAAPVAQSLNAAARALRLRAETVRGRNHRHLRALPEGNIQQRTASEPATRIRCLQTTANPPPGARSAPGAIALMLMLCLSWGFNQIAVKLALPDIPPMLQAHDPLRRRAAGAAADRAAARRANCSSATARWAPGLFAGLLFGIEFVLIFSGLLLTSASRAVVFLYTAPFFVALGSYQFLGERLRASQWGGPRLELCRRRARDRRAAGRCRCQGAARRSPDRRRRRAVGGDHADRQGDARCCGRRAGKGAGLPGRDLDPDSGAGGAGFPAKP